MLLRFDFLVYMEKIFILIKDSNVGNMLEEILSLEKYGVKRIGSLGELRKMLNCEHPEIILTDQTYENGCERIVAGVGAKTNVIVLGHHDDYYMPKYRTRRLGVREAVIKINAHFRYGEKRCFGKGDILIDIPCSEMIVGNMAVYLTKTELIIMQILIVGGYGNVPLKFIIDSIRSHGIKCTESSLRQHVSNLRHKLSYVGSKTEIVAAQGIGYTMICR